MVYSRFVGIEYRSLHILHLEVTQGLVIEYFWVSLIFGKKVNVSNKPRENNIEQYKQLDLWTQSTRTNDSQQNSVKNCL